MNKNKLKTAIEKAKREMLPEYLVHGRIEKNHNGGMAIFLFIVENYK